MKCHIYPKMENTMFFLGNEQTCVRHWKIYGKIGNSCIALKKNKNHNIKTKYVVPIISYGQAEAMPWIFFMS